MNERVSGVRESKWDLYVVCCVERIRENRYVWSGWVGVAVKK